MIDYLWVANWFFLIINLLFIFYILTENKESNRTMKITKLTEQQRTEDNRIKEKRETIIAYNYIMEKIKDQ